MANARMNLAKERFFLEITNPAREDYRAAVVVEGTYGELITLAIGRGRSEDEAVSKAKAIIRRKVR